MPARRRFDPPAGSFRPRVAVIGAGIVGLAHAWAAARRGWDVQLFERDRSARGASIRNFGMVWPIGQPPGTMYDAALRSRELWEKLLTETSLWSHPSGSLHLAYRQDEWHVLQEYSAAAGAEGRGCQLLSPHETLQKSAGAKAEGLLGALWSPTEICVDPRQVIAQVPAWLRDRYGINTHFGVPIARVEQGIVTSSAGDAWKVDRIIIAAGAELHLLCPEVLRAAGFKQCKLQMLRTRPQPNGWKLGPMIAGGLTLRHYDAFRECQSLAALQRRVAEETPDLDRFGIHVLAAQNGLGEVILGDSHEYDADASPFDKAEIEDLILRELRRMIDLPDWTIAERWHGVYLKRPGCVEFTAEPQPGIHVSVASGGCGMTMSFGLADKHWADWDNADPISAGMHATVETLPRPGGAAHLSGST